MVNKAEIMDDINIQDQNHPSDEHILGDTVSTEIDNITKVPAMVTMRRLKK